MQWRVSDPTDRPAVNSNRLTRIILPRREPGRVGLACFRPHAGKRAEERIFISEAAKTCTYRIHPDVPGDVVRGIVAAKDVVVEFFLPERFPCLSRKRRGCFGFENLYKMEEIAGGVETLKQEMDVIRH